MAHKPNPKVLNMALKKQANIDAGLVSIVFPSVSEMAINMNYFRKSSNPLLMVRKVKIYPTSYACFNMDCMIPKCEGGGFNLTPIVTDMVKTRKKIKKGTLTCQGIVEKLSSDHASIEYEIVINYI